MGQQRQLLCEASREGAAVGLGDMMRVQPRKIPALAFSNAKVWAQGSGDKSVTETNTTALDLSSLSLPAMTQVICPCRLPVGMEDASQPAQGCMVTPTWPCPHMHTMHVPMLASMHPGPTQEEA